MLYQVMYCGAQYVPPVCHHHPPIIYVQPTDVSVSASVNVIHATMTSIICSSAFTLCFVFT